MKNYKMIISYDGGRYHGWEHKKDVDTVQTRIERVLARMCDEEIWINGAGRTDAGVHAQGMVANAHMETPLSSTQIRDCLNRYLPDDIAVLEVREASDRFHARFNAVGKLYRYTCYDGPIKPVFERKYTYTLEKTVDINRMKEAADYLVGEHDFKSFCGNPKMKKSTVRLVDSIEIRRKGGYVILDFHGTGFLQNMVRILTGTLLEVGYGKMEPEQMTQILEAKERAAAGPTAPPQGLSLIRVDY